MAPTKPTSKPLPVINADRRLTRSAAPTTKTAEFASRTRLSQGAKTRASGLGKELALLEVDGPDTSAKSSARVRQGTGRYDLRASKGVGRKGVLGVNGGGVSTARSSGGEKGKGKKEKIYVGPGYRREGGDEENEGEGRECEICADVVGEEHFPNSTQMGPCQHKSKVCRSCIARYAETQLQGNGKWTGLQCLDSDCGRTLSKDRIWVLLWMGDWERLDDLSARRARETHPRFRSCLSSTCALGQIHYSYKNPVVTCTSCGSRSCFNHRTPWHDGYSCDAYDDSHPDAQSTRTSEDRLKSMAKKCPGEGCAFYVEKDGGCPNMYCSRCGLSWNWDKVKYEAKAGVIYKTKK